MNVAIFGASGVTGTLLTERSLAAGYNVTALVRRPAKFPLRNKVRIIKGSIFDPTPVHETIEGADVILSTLGAHSPFRNENLLPRAIPRIIETMRRTGVKRIIVLGSAGALANSLDKQPAWRRWIIENVVYTTFLKWPVAEQIAQYTLLSKSNLDWTMLMPPMLTNSAPHGTYRIDADALPPKGVRISRADVADFMMQQISNSKWIKKGVYLSW
ncbi:MAG TPA: SDR family oxidoreductase [Edaphobacter sp.]|jgi:putative NADH-flavin reductase|nr:SDR family oxidoreductase [Edaphobacter sp.]